MIAFVRGRASSVSGDVLVVDMGAVGLSVHCTATALREVTVGALVDLPATLVVREDSLTLYGFADARERHLFDLLQTVSGVGPRVAQSILSTLGAGGLHAALAGGDVKALTTVSGVGRKGAERLIVELKDRVEPVTTAEAMARPAVTEGWQGTVRSGLMSLGWSPRDADAAIAVVESDAQWAQAVAAADVAVLLRAALRGLDRA